MIIRWNKNSSACFWSNWIIMSKVEEEIGFKVMMNIVPKVLSWLYEPEGHYLICCTRIDNYPQRFKKKKNRNSSFLFLIIELIFLRISVMIIARRGNIIKRTLIFIRSDTCPRIYESWLYYQIVSLDNVLSYIFRIAQTKSIHVLLCR